ncbi:DNA/RNA polymerase [Exidia glandulosa HHB12029]|uniref:DNA polymerase kappa n=1 Tax=Exidia glandulosa HHB12029 TaxID=1314781 RepID=A0A165JNM1_EXIGL|nr:DNA/RNA polymerase [Exidia glandulosa HHB12029]
MSQASASLLKRLAGPSVTKAGLATDQSAINAVIAEVSKGSKFYENEKRKDQAVTEKIEKILKERDELLKYANIERIEHQVDNIIAELEANRDISQYIVHFDMDSFFASVEILHDPSLKDKAFVVGGSVVSTASYAARKFGVRSGMALFVAQKLCPTLIALDTRHGVYGDISKDIMAIIRKYDPEMCVAGCDEGYLNITSYCEENSMSPDDCVTQMRREVFEATKLTVSAGIAPNMVLAKICSDKNKPNGQFHLPFEKDKIIDFMHDLPIRKVPGVGRVQERLLDSIGIKNCGDIYTHRAVVHLLGKHFSLDYLLHAYLGLGSTSVQPGQREERKSVGVERTFDPISDQDKLIAKLDHIAQVLEEDLKHGGWTGKTITLKYKLDTFQSMSRAKSLPRYISKKADLFAIGKELLLAEMPLRIRLLGLRVTNLKDLKLAESAGIKRFFKSAPDSPNKKRRLSHDQDNVDATDSAAEQSGSTSVSVAPFRETSFFDDDALESAPYQRAASHEPSGSQPDPAVSALASKPASSAGPLNVPIFSPIPRPNDKPKVKKSKPPSDVSGQRHDCPICGKTLETDNGGLNAHIDYCLSRAAIKELANAPAATSQSGAMDRGAKQTRNASVKAAKTAPFFHAAAKKKGR